MQGRFVWQRSVAARTPFSVPDAASAAEYIGCVVVTHAWVLVSGSLPQHGCRHVCLPAYRQVFNNNGKHCPCPVHPPLLQSCSRTQQSACVHSHVGDCSESQAPASCKRLWTRTTATCSASIASQQGSRSGRPLQTAHHRTTRVPVTSMQGHGLNRSPAPADVAAGLKAGAAKWELPGVVFPCAQVAGWWLRGSSAKKARFLPWWDIAV